MYNQAIGDIPIKLLPSTFAATTVTSALVLAKPIGSDMMTQEQHKLVALQVTYTARKAIKDRSVKCVVKKITILTMKKNSAQNVHHFKIAYYYSSLFVLLQLF